MTDKTQSPESTHKSANVTDAFYLVQSRLIVCYYELKLIKCVYQFVDHRTELNSHQIVFSSRGNNFLLNQKQNEQSK